MAKSILLKNIKKINEEIIGLSKPPEIIQKLMGAERHLINPSNEVRKALPYAYIVYTDKCFLILARFLKNKKEKRRSFKEELESFIELYNPKGYADFLFFVGAFNRMPINGPSMKELLSWRFQKYEPIDAILSDSRGLLLWEYQFDNLLKYFGAYEWKRIMEFTIKNKVTFPKIDPATADRWQTLLFLDNGFMNSSKYRELMKTLKFTDRISMYDVMKERRIDYARYPDFKAAYVLYTTLKNG
jgi:hypothetical protein